MAQGAHRDSSRWFGHYPATQTLPNQVLCLAGEVGELANLVKKIVRGDFTLDEKREEVENEVADIFTYFLCIAGLLEIDPQWVYERKHVLNEARFGRE